MLCLLTSFLLGTFYHENKPTWRFVLSTFIPNHIQKVVLCLLSTADFPGILSADWYAHSPLIILSNGLFFFSSGLKTKMFNLWIVPIDQSESSIQLSGIIKCDTIYGINYAVDIKDMQFVEWVYFILLCGCTWLMYLLCITHIAFDVSLKWQEK